MFETLKQHRTLVQQYGLRRCLFRMWYDAQRKSKRLSRRFPAWHWQDKPLADWVMPGVPRTAEEYRCFREQSDRSFFFPLGQPVRVPADWTDDARQLTENLRRGVFPYFSVLNGELGYPNPNWFRNPFTGRKDSAAQHWCEREDFDSERGDIKYIWEPSRFCWAYALVRAYATTPDNKYAEMFWRLFESWLVANPPQMGPNWQCGQEIAIRLLACVFALYAFWHCPATTDGRIAALVVLVAASAERIAGNIDFARAQMGNHATSEAAGLWTAAILFPELAGARRWKELARHVLEDEARQFNLPDGSYIQHSMNYQRVMLHAYLWCLRLAELNGEVFSDALVAKMKKSYEFLYQMQDPLTGKMPNYGPNDGANILPLDGCDYLDYRPIIGAMHFFHERTQLYATGPWSEDLLWFFGPGALEKPTVRLGRKSSSFLSGGYFSLRGPESWCLVRCHTYRNRPNQADMLHVDLWWRGLNILRDSGSFTYYDPTDHWNNFFASTAAHNCVMCGGADQMIKGPRFRWYSLVRARVIGCEQKGTVEVWQGEHYGYQRLPSRIVCRRSICRVADDWLIVDDVLGEGKEQVRLLWQLLDANCSLEENTCRLDASRGLVQAQFYSSADWQHLALVRGQDQPERLGWQSLYYGVKEPAPTIYMDICASLPVRLISLFSLGRACSADSDGSHYVKWTLPTHGEVQVEMAEALRQRTALTVHCAGETIRF